MLRYAFAASVAAAIALAGWGLWLRADNADLQADIDAKTALIASKNRSIETLRNEVEQARAAAEVAKAYADAARAKAEEYDRIREALIKGGQDAELPEWFRDLLDALGVGLH